MSTGIIVALPEELKTLTRLALKSQQPHKLSNNLYIILAGMGANNARLAAEKLMALGTKKLISRFIHLNKDVVAIKESGGVVNSELNDNVRLVDSPEMAVSILSM